MPKALRFLRRDLRRLAADADAPALCRLVDNGLDPATRMGDGETLLHVACLFGDGAFAERLLQTGVDVDAPDRQGRTPLRTAVDSNAPATTVRVLLAAGADPFSTAKDGLRPLDAAEQVVRRDLVELFATPGPQTLPIGTNG